MAVHQHIGIGLVGHRTVAVAFTNIGAHLSGCGAAPERLKIIMLISQVSHGFVVAQGAAGPDFAIGCQVHIGNACITRDYLAFFL